MGTTVGDVIISYDINRYHTDVKNEMMNLGYRTVWSYTGEPIYHLPNTTLVHQSKSSDQAMADLKNICLRLSVTLEKAVAVKAAEFVGV
jgi:hypothetical protein